jgi:hypothetical protein
LGQESVEGQKKDLPSDLANRGRVSALPDDKGAKEAVALANNTLEDESKRNDHKRREGIRDHAKWGAVTLFWIFVVLVIFSIFAFAFHLLMPVAWHWLSLDQQDKIKTILFSGALASVATGYSKKYF